MSNNSSADKLNLEKKIQKTIRALQNDTSTTEYKARELFSKLGYSVYQDYYKDWDGDKDISREIDVSALRMINYGKGLEQKPLLVEIIADVKFRESDLEMVLIAFDNEPIDKSMILTGKILDPKKERRKHLIKWFIDPERKLPYMDLASLDSVNIYQDFFIKEFGGKISKKRSSKEIIKNGSKQVLSALNSNIKNFSSYKMNDPIIMIPMLIFGNKIQLVEGSLKEIINEKYEITDFVIYRAQVPSNLISSNYISGLTFPVIFTTLDKLEKTLKSIQNLVIEALNTTPPKPA
ncbi:MAG: hypothetical protein HeimC2_34300 [Candidatus Heimdallarchaeota archaeon LC_2]|nr:MAG: hypothetical protein HeimC2_34300 [Candidatus Heimdallarchaeota archaeon LC_2]